MSRQIVINLGLPKSGTTTLAHALRKAGYKVADYRIRWRDTENGALRGRFVGGQMYRGYFESGDPLQTLGEFDGFSEIGMTRGSLSFWPQTDWGLISAIRNHHPGVKFLASARSPKDQALSMLKWSNMGIERLPKHSIPGLPRGFGQTNLQRAQWISGHHAFLAQVFAGADDFLEFDIADITAPAQISAFLGRDLPWWGRLNTNPDTPLKRLNAPQKQRKKIA